MSANLKLRRTYNSLKQRIIENFVATGEIACISVSLIMYISLASRTSIDVVSTQSLWYI
jgi:hypothetical protein